ncbi:MAG: DUF5716 family protein [Pseudomonadales bacterium]|nr:DUF5716 family protein [Pseudomonadales bacterium]
MVLFEQERTQFFKPLTSKYRAVIVECLRLLYNRLYSANADYGESLRREQVMDIFEEALARAPVMDSGDDAEQDQQGFTRFKSEREQANWILNLLIDHGWIEKQVDQATLQSTFPFSRYGRLFTQSLVEVGATQIRTRHRNTRNTLNALEAFWSRGEVHDLLDAYEYSERIISDFTDVIAELEERKRELVRQVEAQLLVQQATDQFFEFMEKRFQPDVSVRLSADSVEKHRDAIHRVIGKIRRKRKDFKRDAELKLREMAPELIRSQQQSVLYDVLDMIETRMRNAADLMLPALRRALQSFTKRADIIIRQLTYLHSQKNNDVVEVCQQLASMPEQEQSERLTAAGQLLANIKLQLIDPDQIKLQHKREQRVVSTLVSEQQALDETARKELLIQNLLDQAFIIQNDTMRNYLLEALGGGERISTKDLPVKNARDLLAMAHAVEAAAQSSIDSDYRFNIEYQGTDTQHEYFKEYDVFNIELLKNE